MKVYLSPSSQTGNVEIGSFSIEAERIQQLSSKVKTKLQALGQTVYGSDNRLDLTDRIAASNVAGVSAHIGPHSNARGSTGPEVWYHTTSTNCMRLAQYFIDENAVIPGCPLSRGINASTGYQKLKGTTDANWIVDKMDSIA